MIGAPAAALAVRPPKALTSFLKDAFAACIIGGSTTDRLMRHAPAGSCGYHPNGPIAAAPMPWDQWSLTPSPPLWRAAPLRAAPCSTTGRHSSVSGKGCSVRVNHGGGRYLQKNKKNKQK